MKFSQFSTIAFTTLAVMLLTPAIMPLAAFSQPSDRLQSNRNTELNLTDAQKQQMLSLKQNTRTQINAVLTDAQRTQLETAIKSGSKPRAAMQSLNLSEDQRTRIRAIKESAKTQRQVLLTPEQRQKLQSRSNRMGKLSKLNLSDDQKLKMRRIIENTRQKISKILTTDQKAQLGQGKKGDQRRSMQVLNLSEAQKEQIKTLKADSKNQIGAILTPTQLQEFNTRGDRRGNFRNKA